MTPNFDPHAVSPHFPDWAEALAAAALEAVGRAAHQREIIRFLR